MFSFAILTIEDLLQKGVLQMKTDKTELVFILDKSGSMSGLESDVTGGFNGMLRKQKQLPGECFLTTILFDTRVELLHDRLDIRAVSPVTERDYCPGGGTALLDAIGMGIEKIKKVQAQSAEKYRADHVIFVITTDGMENASTMYRHREIRNMISEMKEKYGWEFIFSAANIDAEEMAESLSIDKEKAFSYAADDKGIEAMYEISSRFCTKARENK